MQGTLATISNFMIKSVPMMQFFFDCNTAFHWVWASLVPELRHLI